MTHTLTRWLVTSALISLLLACAGGPEKPQPGPLPAVSGQLSVKNVWSNKVGVITTPIFALQQGDNVAVASSQGQVALINAMTGQDVWRLQLDTPIQAGVGGDGQRLAVINQNNEVLAIEAGKVLWRYRLPAMSYTAPLVAGGRVFVLSADRVVTALDGASGQKLWTQQRPGGEPLVLQQAGLLMSFGDTLLAGWGGRLAALNPNTGVVRWESLVGSTRGTNEVERLVDLVAGASRQGSTLCVRAFQSAVSCLDVGRGNTLWTRPAQGHVGLDGDERLVFGVESDSKVVAWQRPDGQTAWTQSDLRFQGLTAPLVLGRSVVMGDEKGLIHFLSRVDGQTLQRMSTDGSAIVGKPVAVGQTLVVVTRTGGIFGFRPQ